MSSASVHAAGIQSAVLVAFRALLFCGARRFLLRHVYQDLQDLSAATQPPQIRPPPGRVESGQSQDSTGTELELDTLPAPASAPSTSNSTSVGFGGRRRHFHSVLSRALFALCFSESCVLFLLLICQALEVFHPRVRLFHWQVSLCILVVAIVLVIPLSYSLVLSNRSKPPGISSGRQQVFSMSLALYLIPNFLFLLGLSYVPLPAGMPTHSIMASALSRLTVIGTVILGGLSGFGAIDTAWDFFPVFSRNRRPHPTDDEVRIAEAGLRRVREDLGKRQDELQTLAAAKLNDAQSSHWLYRALPAFQGSSESSSLAQEVTGLQALEYEMARNLEALKQRQAHAKFSHTLAGWLFNWGGRLFALYCIYRIIASTMNLVIPRTPGGQTTASTNADAVSFVLAYMLSVLPFVQLAPDGVAVISRQISLGLVGAIILGSIRRVLRGVARVLRVASRSLGASLMLLMLAQVMGIYLLSTLIQLRTSFPPPPDTDDDGDAGMVNLFSTLPEYQFFGALFDGTFLIAAGASAGVRWFAERVGG